VHPVTESAIRERVARIQRDGSFRRATLIARAMREHNDGLHCARCANDACIHPGLFATGPATEHCYHCGRDVPRWQL
jgi:hypothetical protein